MPISRPGITTEQRRALRRWHREQGPGTRQKDVIDWFERQYGRRLRQSTISESLSARHANLDIDAPGGIDEANDSRIRYRPGQWALLEPPLLEWYQSMVHSGTTPNGDAIMEQARDLWLQVPQYSNLPIPAFSNGWLSGFKKRNGIATRPHRSHRAADPSEPIQASPIQANTTQAIPAQAGPIELTATVEDETHYRLTLNGDQLPLVEQREPTEKEQAAEQSAARRYGRAVPTLCGKYYEEDIFVMEETGLFWRSALFRRPGAAQREGYHADAAKIMLVCCCNYLASERFTLWLIGKTTEPSCIRGLNTEQWRVEWHGNKTGSMEIQTMMSWLRAYYKWIGKTRSVLLLMSSSPAHSMAIECQPPPQNIRIQWLPTNDTKMYSPLHQGIFQDLRRNYRRYWLEFMVKTNSGTLSTLERVDMYDALRWISKAWFWDVTIHTIYRCFRKSRLQPSQQPIDLPAAPPHDLQLLYRQAQRAGGDGYRNTLPLAVFLDPGDEDGPPPPWGHDGLAEAEPIDDNASDLEFPDAEEWYGQVPTVAEAAKAVDCLMRFRERQHSTDTTEFNALIRLERSIRLWQTMSDDEIKYLWK